MLLSGEAPVASIKVHPNAEAVMLLREQPYPEAVSYDHQRTLLVQFADAATEEMIKEYGEVRRLKLVRLNYRGASGLAAFEVRAPADFAATARMLGEELSAPHLPVTSIRALVERAEVVIPEAQAPAAAEEKAPEAAAVPRRDPAQAWVEYLQNATLADGKSKLNDKQIQLITYFLKPIAKSPDDQRAPVVARTEEIKRALPIITSPRGMRNSIILVGEAGVGKTAIAEGLAEMAEEAEHAALTGESSHLDFARLKGRWLVELDINEVLASEDPVKTLSAILKLLPLLNEKDAGAGNKVIVLMDEIQKFFLDPQGTKIANILKNPLRNGEISVIAGTTSKEYKTHVEKDDAFRRRLEKIDVEEFTVEKTIRVLRAMKAWFQKLHKALIPDQALVDAAKLTDQFDKTNFNPDKAIKAIQDASELSRPENLRAAIALDIRETWGSSSSPSTRRVRSCSTRASRARSRCRRSTGTRSPASSRRPPTFIRSTRASPTAPARSRPTSSSA
ncbi:MAG: AAA family ATPase [Elusimicrobiota bacterium]|nr:MAG: AAA family ATPase [Elusimicrobiota bacterium]